MEALITAILRTVLGALSEGGPAPATSPNGSSITTASATTTALAVDVFNPIELLREGNGQQWHWSPRTTVSPNDRDAGYLLVIRPAAMSAASTAGGLGVVDSSAAAQNGHNTRASVTVAVGGAEPSAFASDVDQDEEALTGHARRSASPPLPQHEDTRRTSAGRASSTGHRPRSTSSHGGGGDGEEEEALLPQYCVEWQRRTAFLIWVSAHFLSSRSLSLLNTIGQTGVSANTPTGTTASTRTVTVPLTTVDLWCREYQRAHNNDVLICDALCVRPWEVVSVETDTLFLTARERRIQAITLAVRDSPASPRTALTSTSSAFAAAAESITADDTHVAEVAEYCFAFHTGGLTRFVTALRSLLPPRIVRDMMLQQAANVSSIQISQATAALAKPTTASSTASTGLGPEPTVAALPPPALCEASSADGGGSGSPTSSGRAASRRGTWKVVSKWANASLKKMKDSWQTAGGGHPLQGQSGETEDSDGDLLDMSTVPGRGSAAEDETGTGSSTASSASRRHVDAAQQLVPCLTLPTHSSVEDGHVSAATAAPLTEDEWAACFVPGGRLDPALFERARERVFRGGVEASVRQEVWLYLLEVFPVSASADERAKIAEENATLYARCTDQWQSFTAEQLTNFHALRAAMYSVEKDVARTDRHMEVYRDDASPRLRTLQRVLMAHVMVNFDLGYCQGMSDVVSALALLCDSEETVFLLFSRVLARQMRANFSMDPRDGMPARLRDLEIVVRHFFPELHAHLRANASNNMMFCFRWILMAFKREFPSDDLYTLWDVLFAAPAKSDFDLVVAAGLLKGLETQLLALRGCDRVVLFANNLNGHVAVREVLWYAHDFYQQMCAEYARLAALCPGGDRGVAKAHGVSVHAMAALCLTVDGALLTDEL